MLPRCFQATGLKKFVVSSKVALHYVLSVKYLEYESPHICKRNCTLQLKSLGDRLKECQIAIKAEPFGYPVMLAAKYYHILRFSVALGYRLLGIDFEQSNAWVAPGLLVGGVWVARCSRMDTRDSRVVHFIDTNHVGQIGGKHWRGLRLVGSDN